MPCGIKSPRAIAEQEVQINKIMATLCWHVIFLSYPTSIYYDFLYLPYLIFICTLYPVFKFKLHLTVASLNYKNSYTTFRCKLLAILKSVMYPLVKKTDYKNWTKLQLWSHTGIHHT